MELDGEVRINAPKQMVYDALNDPDILKQCIPGCQELIQHSATELEAVVTLKIGPLKANFKGNVTLDPSNAPDGFSLAGEGKGGSMGFAKGGADVTLEEDGDGTILRYTAKAAVGGKMAQLGSRLILGTAKKLSADFFKKFSEATEERMADTGSQQIQAEIAEDASRKKGWLSRIIRACQFWKKDRSLT